LYPKLFIDQKRIARHYRILSLRLPPGMLFPREAF
jgi:hypothetical protein